jgi:hypothetical protein
MKAPRNNFSERQASTADRSDRGRAGTGVVVTPIVEQDDAELAESAVDLQVGLQVTDVSDTMSNDLIDQLFAPVPRSR